MTIGVENNPDGSVKVTKYDSPQAALAAMMKHLGKGAKPKKENDDMSNKQIVGKPVFQMINDKGEVLLIMEGGYPVDLLEPEWVPKLYELCKIDVEALGSKNSYGRTLHKLVTPKPGAATSEPEAPAQPDPEHTA